MIKGSAFQTSDAISGGAARRLHVDMVLLDYFGLMSQCRGNCVSFAFRCTVWHTFKCTNGY